MTLDQGTECEDLGEENHGFQLMEINCKTERENEMNCQAWSMAIY